MAADRTAALQHGRAAMHAQRWAEAEAAADAALALWPRDQDLLILRAGIGQRQMHWADAHRWYSELREHHPDHLFGWSRDGEMLRWLKRPDDAEALLAEAVARFPTNEEVLVQRILAACDLRNWPAAEARAAAMLDCMPDKVSSYRYAAEAFARQGRALEAESLIAEGMQLPGTHPFLTQRFAELAAARKEWKAAARRWRTVLRQTPDLEIAHRGLATALRELGDATALEGALAAACERLPNSLHLAIEHAWAAAARRDWDVALPRWQALMVRAPDNGMIRQGYENALIEARVPIPTVSIVSTAVASPVIDVSMAVDDAETVSRSPELVEIMTYFESLGQNCEFGLVQRRAGVEALSLLRFSFIRAEQLVAALDHDFAGVGEPEFTQVYLRDGLEYMTTDTRYGLNMHSFTGPSQVTMERFSETAHRRFQFLARKMREDLCTASKIYVRSPGDLTMTLEDVLGLHAALCRHADNTLLYVEPSPDPGRAGTAEWVAPGVLWGWTSRYDMNNIDHDNWRSVCRAAHALWMAQLGQRMTLSFQD